MRIIGVIDVLAGRAVHARAGDRSKYVPIERAAGVQIDGSVEALARAYVDRLGVKELYVADLDAIARGVSAMSARLIRSVAALGVPVWVDAGASTAADAERVVNAGAATVIVGLETLSSFETLMETCGVVGGDRVAFSLDLRDGVPIGLPNVVLAGSGPESLAQRGVAAGVGSVIVLDLARVGMDAGVDVALMSRIREAVSTVRLFAGGGVRSVADLDRLAAAGIHGALVATALLNGSLKV
jgi:phosphoribosylformimino-5-aminoimidazole carboxamide ribotide isomerase